MSLKSGEVYFSEQSGSFTIPESISLFGFSVSFFGATKRVFCDPFRDRFCYDAL